jgi:hypothetical protein
MARRCAPFRKYSHIKDPKTMDVLIFKGRQVSRGCARVSARTQMKPNTSLVLRFSKLEFVQHLEEVRMQYKVKAQLQYFLNPPDHADKAAILGNEEVCSLPWGGRCLLR